MGAAPSAREFREASKTAGEAERRNMFSNMFSFSSRSICVPLQILIRQIQGARESEHGNWLCGSDKHRCSWFEEETILGPDNAPRVGKGGKPWSPWHSKRYRNASHDAIRLQH